MANYYKQVGEVGSSGESLAPRNLHISVFFDGTRHNETYDTRQSVPPCPTNIARLYHATLVEPQDGYFACYIPGVGAPFPDIGELDFTTLGMAFANRGEDRINWAMLQVVDALTVALTGQSLPAETLQDKLRAMATTWPLTGLGKGRRRRALASLLKPLRARLVAGQTAPAQIRLYIYGFSRGAAQARTFVSWLSELLPTPRAAVLPQQQVLGIPLSIEFLGLIDTVASVGSARATPFTEGHMDWADGTQSLPDSARFPGLIKMCRHYVAAHEQRLCFALDSIRYTDGYYPDFGREVIYPGMHSDVGGGYAPGAQGRARGGQSDLLSQIVLHDLYAAAFAAGAPLAVVGLPTELEQIQPWRQMTQGVQQEFEISAQLVERFNAWRGTLSMHEEARCPATASYEVTRMRCSLEEILVEQLGWLTGWRIERYARGSYANQPFFGLATQTNASRQAELRVERQTEIEAIKDQRRKIRGQPDELQILKRFICPPPYQPAIDQQQMREAAIEFEHDYHGWRRNQTSPAGWVADVLLKDTIYLLTDADERREHKQIKIIGEQCREKLFDEFTPLTREHRAALVALLDDHVHDSRAWFLHDTIGSRELWGNYFRYRTVIFESRTNKCVTSAKKVGRMVGVSLVLGASAAVAGGLA
ncbi:DUF2235 domain-containing protein [Pseudomonas sp. Pseusp122]|uniref:T6SS phospholipase effector Tle1-like catalytic domain-containing protein n=1 Tax=unclassified Pseudomonas TaxID=196821 RepID=UPI0039A53638